MMLKSKSSKRIVRRGDGTEKNFSISLKHLETSGMAVSVIIKNNYGNLTELSSFKTKKD